MIWRCDWCRREVSTSEPTKSSPPGWDTGALVRATSFGKLDERSDFCHDLVCAECLRRTKTRILDAIRTEKSETEESVAMHDPERRLRRALDVLEELHQAAKYVLENNRNFAGCSVLDFKVHAARTLLDRESAAVQAIVAREDETE